MKETAIGAQSPADAAQSREEIRRRVILQLATAGLLIFILVVGLVAWGLSPKRLTPSERAALIEYEKIRLALADDDLAGALRSTMSLRASFPQLPISNQALALQQCTSLESARQVFKEMSQPAAALVRGVDGYFIGECPPGYKCPIKCSPCRMSEFGPWVQISRELHNPFMGKKNAQCGLLRRA